MKDWLFAVLFVLLVLIVVGTAIAGQYWFWSSILRG